MAGPSIRKNFAWTLFGNTFYMACQWLIVIVIAKVGSADMVGQFTLAIAIATPVLMMAGLSLRVVQSNDPTGRRSFGNYLGLRVVTTVLALFVIAGLALGGGYRPETRLIVLVIGLAKAAEAISEVVWGQLQRQERLDVVARSMMFKGAVTVAAFTGTLVATDDLGLATTSLMFAWIGTLVLYDLAAARKLVPGSLRPTFDRGPLMSLAWTALPLGVGMLLISLSVNVPRYFLAHHGGDAALGMFSAIANLLIIGLSVMMALGQAIGPRLAGCYVRRDAVGFRRLVRLLFIIAVGLGLLGIATAYLAGGPLLRIIYTSEYVAAWPVLNILVLAAVPAYFLSVFGFIVNAAGAFRPQVPVQLINLGVIVGGCWYAVPRWGLEGAAWAIAAANLAAAIAGAVVAYLSVRELQVRAGRAA